MPDTKPQIAAADEARVNSVSGWDPAKVNSAERQADAGTYTAAGDLVERLLTDDRIEGVADKLAGVASLPLDFEPASEDADPETDPQAMALAEDWWDFLSEDLLSHLVKWGRILGIGVLHVRGWEPGPSGRLIPVLETWHPRNIGYNYQSREWFAIVDGGSQIPITPGDGGWVVWTPYGAKRPVSRAPWRGLALWWLLKSYAIQDWGLYSNRHGSGLYVAKNTGATRSIDNPTRVKLGQALAALGRRGSVVLPDGFDLALVEAQAKTWETFQAQIQLADRAIAISLAGQNLSTDVEGGSYAAASVHQAIEATKIHQIAAGMSTCLRTQLVSWWASLNFGDPALAPWPKWNLDLEQDQGELVKRLYPIGSFLGQIVDRGVDVDPIAFAAQFGVKIPLREGGDAFMVPSGSQDASASAVASAPQASMRQRVRAFQAASRTGERNGSDFTMGLEQDYSDAAVEAMRGDVAAILEVVRGESDPLVIRRKLVEAYEGFSPVALAALLEQAEILSAMAGGAAVLEDM
jgi:hypothetical protein